VSSSRISTGSINEAEEEESEDGSFNLGLGKKVEGIRNLGPSPAGGDVVGDVVGDVTGAGVVVFDDDEGGG